MRLEAHDLADISDGNPKGLMVVDCGYVEDQAGCDNCDRLLALGIGRANVSLVLYPFRLYVTVPKGKRELACSQLPLEVGGFWGSTHRFAEPAQEV